MSKSAGANSRLNGVEGVSAIQRLSPRTKIVVLTSAPDEREEIAALKAGAKGYCDRDIAPPLLEKAVQRVQKGEVWIGRKVISSFIEELAGLTYGRETATPGERRRTLKLLTSRELEVAYLIGFGARNREIANRLKVAERTVKAHVTSIFRKLSLSNRSQLTLFVAKLGRAPVRSADSPRGRTRTQRPSRKADPGGHGRV